MVTEAAPVDAPIIPTVSDDQHAILRSIAALYTGGTFDCDPTYSTGQFYRAGVPEPRLKFDLVPRTPDVVQADCRDLPLPSASIASIVFDPPFLHCEGQDAVIGQRFTDRVDRVEGRKAFYQRDWLALYHVAATEFYRVLRPGGILVWKCQDTVQSGQQVWQHIHIFEVARFLNFVGVDLFILTSPTRLIGHNHHQQQHARKFHSYFWVFQKGKR